MRCCCAIDCCFSTTDASSPRERSTTFAGRHHFQAPRSRRSSLRSRDLGVLARKDLAELFASRAFWLLLLIVGLLTGQAFTQAVDSYAAASGLGRGASARAQGMSPLDGVLTPTLGAFDLAIMLLFPFVAIRLISAEKSSSALKLILQWPVARSDYVLAKLIALMAAWLLSLTAFFAAIVLWASYGG